MSGCLQVAEYEPAAVLRTSEEHGDGLGSSVGCTRDATTVPVPGGAPCPQGDGTGMLRQGPVSGEGSGKGAAAAEGDRAYAHHVHGRARASSSSAATAGEGAGGGTAAAEGHRKATDRVQAAHDSKGLAGGHAGGAEPAALDSCAAKARHAEPVQKTDHSIDAEVLEHPGGCDLQSGKRQHV